MIMIILITHYKIEYENLLHKIFQILQYHINEIKQTFSNSEIFNIFESNKLILLFLFENKVITIDNDICHILMSKSEVNGNRHCHFFYPEIKEFVGEEKSQNILNDLLSIDSNILDHFNEKRHEGENDSYAKILLKSSFHMLLEQICL